ncbi:hypothetical protein BDR04DRAFT_1098623 [Suillus decipiens]|nr:hypothetical protein BDR04DRAFT_1098623 [Suillus decipiens]
MSLLNVKDPTVRRYTRISERSLRYLWKTHLETGEVVRTLVCAGRPRILNSLNANFLEAVSSDNQIFSLRCKFNCGRLVMSKFRLQQFPERYTGEDLCERRYVITQLSLLVCMIRSMVLG